MIAVLYDTDNNSNSDKISIVTLWFSTYNLPSLDFVILRKFQLFRSEFPLSDRNEQTVKIKGWLVH